MIISKSITYVVLNYVGFLFMFLNSLIMGSMSGIRIFGVYSFILLVNQYFYYCSLGTHYSLGTLLAIKKGNSYFEKVILGNTFLINGFISIVILLLVILLKFLIADFLSKYEITDEWFFIYTTAVIISYNNLYLQLCRIYNIYKPINLSQTLVHAVLFVLIVVFRYNLCVSHLIGCYLLCSIISLLYFIKEAPIKPVCRFSRKLARIVIARGINLLLYNMSFTFILTAGATAVTIYYTVDEFAQFRFAQNLSSASFMLTSAVTFLIYPKLLNVLYKSDENSCNNIIDRLRPLYTGIYNFTSVSFFLIIPLVYLFYDIFEDMIPTFIMLLLAKVFTNQTELYNVYIVSKKGEWKLATAGYLSVLLVICLSSVFISTKGDYWLVGFSICVSSLFYYLIVCNIACKSLGNTSIFSFLKKDFSFSLSAPLAFLFFSFISKDYIYLPLFGFLLYILMNFQLISKLVKTLIQLNKNDSILEF